MKTHSPQLCCRSFNVLLCMLFCVSGATASWRSSLYPADWSPPTNASFASDKLIQDFSYAGYHRGENPIPEVDGPVFDAVATYGADPSGTSDSTSAIQTAIDAAGAAGGGVVLLPPGSFRLSLPVGQRSVLTIGGDGVVLRGSGPDQTFLLNTTVEMRYKNVIYFWNTDDESSPVYLTADLPNPTKRLPVANTAAFSPGDFVELQWDFTEAWVLEHQQESWWNETDGYPGTSRYPREVMAVNTTENWIEVDIPTRYTVKTRDNARVVKLTGLVAESGVENLSIGNVQHPGSDWEALDYIDPAKSAYDVDNSFLIYVRSSRDCWISNVESFQPSGNSSTCHMLSNGIRLYRTFRTTVRNCSMQRPQYGGGGGNGYMYRLQKANDCLIDGCLAEFSRHGFVVSDAGTSGNVFHQCEDRTTNHATGDTGSYITGGNGSDNHMHFSHSCLWDQCRAYDSFWEARHRGPGHGLTSAHGVYWNTSGSGTAYPTKLVVTEQGRYGYVIGTSGGIDAVVSIDPALNNTAPADHVEGEGLGGTLFPPSLYLDQLARRLGLSGSTVVVVSTDPSDSDSTLAVDLFVDADGTVSTPGSGMAVSGLARELGTRNGTVSFMFDAMKNVSTNLATRGEKLLDGNIYRDSLGKIAVLGEPGGYGLGADAVNREGLAFSMDASSGMDASVNVRISAITVEWFGNGDALTVVNLVTKESLEWVGSIGTNPSFDLDVSSLNLSIQGGEAGGVASIYAHEDSNFRVSGVNIVLTEPTSISFGGSHHTGSSFVLNLKLQGVIPNGVDLYRATDLGGLWESIATDYAGTNYIDTALPTHPAVFYRAGRAMP